MKTDHVEKIEELMFRPVGTSLRFVKFESCGRYEMLDQKMLRKLVPGFGSLNQSAQQRSIKKILRNAEVCTRTINLDIPPFDGKIQGRFTGRASPQTEHLIIPARSIFGLLEFFENPASGAYLLAHILLGYHANKFHAEFRSVPALEFRGVSDDLLAALAGIFRVVAPRRKISKRGLKLQRNPVVNFREDTLSQPSPLDLSSVKVKRKKGTKAAVPPINTPVLIIGASSRDLRELSDSLKSVAVTYANAVGRSQDRACVSLTPRDLCGFDPKIVNTFLEQADGIGCILLRWWHHGQIALPETNDRPGRYRHFAQLSNDILPPLYEEVLYCFLEFLTDEGIFTASDAGSYHEQIAQLFHPQPVDETEMTPPTFDDPNLFLAVVKDIIAQNRGRIMGYNEERQPGKKPIGGWRKISDESFLVLLEEEVKRLYPKLAKARGVPESDFLDPKWLAKLQKAMGKSQFLKLTSKGYTYHYDLVDRGRDNTPVWVVYAQCIDGETLGNANESVPGNSPGFSPNASAVIEPKSIENRRLS